MSSESGPRIPIAGAAGEIIARALARLATHCGEQTLSIAKERVAGGGYVFTVKVSTPPEKPARDI